MKRFKKVFIHVGTDKTGSTSIQMALDLCRTQLAEKSGVFYANGSSHGQLGSLFATDKIAYGYNSASANWDLNAIEVSDKRYRNFLTSWLNTLPTGSTVVFSFEGLFGLDASGLHKMKTFFLDFSEEVKAVIYFRGPFSYAISAMSQRVKMGRQSFSGGPPPVINYKNVLKRLVESFGSADLIVRKFDRDALVHGDVVSDFTSLVGASPEAISLWSEKPIRMNESLSEQALHVGDQVLAHLTDLDLKILPNEFNQVYAGLLSLLPGPPIRLSVEQANIIFGRMKEHLLFLRDHYEIEFFENSDEYICRESLSDEVLANRKQFAIVVANLIAHQRLIRNAAARYENLPESSVSVAGREYSLALSIRNQSPEVWYSFKNAKVSFLIELYTLERDRKIETFWFPLEQKIVPVNALVQQFVSFAIPSEYSCVACRISLFQERVGNLARFGFPEKWISIGEGEKQPASRVGNDAG